MQSIEAALESARKRSIRLKTDIYVVKEGDEYDTATDDDLDNYYLGCRIVGHFYCGEPFGGY